MALIDPITDYSEPIEGESLADAFESASPVGAARPTNILDPGYDLTLRPMRYPQFFEMYRDAIKNTWTVDEIDFSDDLGEVGVRYANMASCLSSYRLIEGPDKAELVPPSLPPGA